MALHSPRGHCARFALVAGVLLAGLAALAAALPAHAQALVMPLPDCIDRPPLPLQVAVAPPGVPEQLRLADPTALVCKTLVEVNNVGGAVALWCGPRLSLYAVRWSAINQQMMADFMALALPGDTPERIRAMQARHQTENVMDMCDVWGPARERFNAAMPAPAPAPSPAAAWRVAKYSLLLTRPAFPVVAGKRSTTAAGRATVGRPCDCAAPIVEGAATWCPADSAPLVTVCVKP